VKGEGGVGVGAPSLREAVSQSQGPSTSKPFYPQLLLLSGVRISE
jgi:hypothetical protein